MTTRTSILISLCLLLATMSAVAQQSETATQVVTFGVKVSALQKVFWSTATNADVQRTGTLKTTVLNGSSRISVETMKHITLPVKRAATNAEEILPSYVHPASNEPRIITITE